MAKNNNLMSMNAVYAYLNSYGIPKHMCDRIRNTLAAEALQNGINLAYNRIYSAVALMLNKHLHFGRKRIMAALKVFDRICGSVLDTDRTWEDVMRELDDRTGLIIRCGDGEQLVCEYRTENEVDVYERPEE